MWLVLCSSADRPALRAACGLRDRGLSPLEVVSIEALLLAPVWEHRIGRDGTASSFVRLHDGRTIDAAVGVLNRVGELPPVPAGAARDGDYIQQERVSLLLSWLASFPNAINRATPQGLAGSWFAPAHAQWLAAQAGLAVLPGRYRGANEPRGQRGPGLPRISVVVLDGCVFGPRLPGPVQEACAAFARLTSTRLVGLDFIRTGNSWVFDASTPTPDFSVGGAALLDALAAAMRGA